MALFSGGEDARSRYYRLLEEFEQSQDKISILLEMLGLLPRMIEESIASLRAGLEELGGRIRDLEEAVESVADISDRYVELNRKVEHVAMTVGSLAEAVLSRVVLDELRARGYTIRRYERNYPVDGEDVDLLVEAEKEGRVEYFLVEVKTRPSHSDVGSLLARADVFEASMGVRPRPVLAGVWIGGRVRSYAEGRGVLVIPL